MTKCPPSDSNSGARRLTDRNLSMEVRPTVGKAGGILGCANLIDTYSESESAQGQVRDPPQWKRGYTNVNCLSGHGTSAQLYTFFKSPDSYSNHASKKSQDYIVAFCYISVLLNIGGTIVVYTVMTPACPGTNITPCPRRYPEVLSQRTSLTSNRAQVGPVWTTPTPSLWFRTSCTVPPFTRPGEPAAGSDAHFIEDRYILRAYVKKIAHMELFVTYWVILFGGGIICLVALIVIYAMVEEGSTLGFIVFFPALIGVGPLRLWVARAFALRAAMVRGTKPQGPIVV
ncbi:hypothetical protein FA13DRAFT_1841678 [Coprinellus micaceus]|uniref:Uncharacterized protein n=1 Tax=Coprinellus micaceus TaxID=71717 RepID=A0A4Y7TF84_COPMI|nr:hypothetical protein FA13DRAFT_1841678 [Coprinellus micaceus]